MDRVTGAYLPPPDGGVESQAKRLRGGELGRAGTDSLENGVCMWVIVHTAQEPFPGTHPYLYL